MLLQGSFWHSDLTYSSVQIPGGIIFRVGWKGDQFDIECRSLQFGVMKSGIDAIRAKLEAAIAEKSVEPYGPKSALIVDVTNIHAHGTDESHLFDSPTSMTDLLRGIQSRQRIKFGSIITVTWNYLPRRGGWESGYVRYDDSSASGRLVRFLDRAFPISRRLHIIEDGTVPFRT